MTHICVGSLTIIGSDNGLSPVRRQATIWTNDGQLLIGPLGKNLSEILIEILIFSFKKKRLKVSSAKWWPFCHGPNVLSNPDSLLWESIMPLSCFLWRYACWLRRSLLWLIVMDWLNNTTSPTQSVGCIGSYAGGFLKTIVFYWI